jgi:hypothetical protein
MGGVGTFRIGLKNRRLKPIDVRQVLWTEIYNWHATRERTVNLRNSLRHEMTEWTFGVEIEAVDAQ